SAAIRGAAIAHRLARCRNEANGILGNLGDRCVDGLGELPDPSGPIVWEMGPVAGVVSRGTASIASNFPDLASLLFHRPCRPPILVVWPTRPPVVASRRLRCG